MVGKWVPYGCVESEVGVGGGGGGGPSDGGSRPLRGQPGGLELAPAAMSPLTERLLAGVQLAAQGPAGPSQGMAALEPPDLASCLREAA